MRVLTMQAPGRRSASGVQLPFDPARPASYLEGSASNFGDYVVIDSMLRLVDVEVAGNVQFTAAQMSALPEVDHLIIRGANYIRPDFDLTSMGEIIEQLGVPVTVMGIGAQAPNYRALDLPKGTIRALRILGEHSTIVGARGAYTAELLKQLGVDNVEPVGCPSFFRTRDRDLTIEFGPGSVDRVAFNMNRHMTGMYGDNPRAINRMQRAWFLELQDSYETVTTYCQGELPEFIAAHRLEDHYDRVRRSLFRTGFATSESDPIIETFMSSSACAGSIGEWEDLVRQDQIVIGMRLHGTTVGLANAIPSIYLVNDSRVHELAAYMGVPYVDLRTLKGIPTIASILNLVDFGPFNSQYADRFDRFATYLTRNGLPTTMKPGSRGNRAPTYVDSQLHPRVRRPRARWLRRRLAWVRRQVGVQH